MRGMGLSDGDLRLFCEGGICDGMFQGRGKCATHQKLDVARPTKIAVSQNLVSIWLLKESEKKNVTAGLSGA
jgi:hypothetical protein